MTHDELSRKLEGLWHDSYKSAEITALWNVVKLHRPDEQGDCYLCTTEYTVTYPCLTIQAIEKELI